MKEKSVNNANQEKVEKDLWSKYISNKNSNNEDTSEMKKVFWDTRSGVEKELETAQSEHLKKQKELAI